MKNVGVNTGTIIMTKKANRKAYRKRKKFDAYCKQNSGSCIIRKATAEELSKYFD